MLWLESLPCFVQCIIYECTQKPLTEPASSSASFLAATNTGGVCHCVLSCGQIKYM